MLYTVLTATMSITTITQVEELQTLSMQKTVDKHVTTACEQYDEIMGDINAATAGIHYHFTLPWHETKTETHEFLDTMCDKIQDIYDEMIVEIYRPVYGKQWRMSVSWESMQKSTDWIRWKPSGQHVEYVCAQ